MDSPFQGLANVSVDSHDARLTENKKTVLAFYEAGLNDKDFEAASKFMGDRYVQHNPLITDGPEGFKGFVGGLAESLPQLRFSIKRIFAEGDYVIVHVHGVRRPGDPGSAIIDIFKLEDGKIVEHWDVIQEVPEGTANSNGMFGEHLDPARKDTIG